MASFDYLKKRYANKNKRKRVIDTDIVPEVSTGDSPTSEIQSIKAVQLPPAPSRIEFNEAPRTTIQVENSHADIKVAGITRGTLTDAITLIEQPKNEGDGRRVLFVGNTGVGKSTVVKAFLRHTSVGVLNLIHDDSKRIPQYPGAVVQSFDNAPKEANTVTIRGEPALGLLVEVEEVAQLAYRLAMAGLPTRLVIDELDRACSPGGRALEGEYTRNCYVRGRAMGLSVIATTQFPHRAPIEVIDTSTVVIMNLEQRALNYLDSRLMFPDEMTECVSRLGKGEFVIREQGKNWNRKLYYNPEY